MNGALIGHDDKIQGNSASVNFMTGLGLGYQWEKHWHLGVLYEHISNGGLAEHNAGANLVGLAVGYRF